jgi:hypothetical protein
MPTCKRIKISNKQLNPTLEGKRKRRTNKPNVGRRKGLTNTREKINQINTD